MTSNHPSAPIEMHADASKAEAAIERLEKDCRRFLDCIEAFVRDWEQLLFDCNHVTGDAPGEWRTRVKDDGAWNSTLALIAKGRAILQSAGRSVVGPDEQPRPTPRRKYAKRKKRQ
jgi:hypothetical protein